MAINSIDTNDKQAELYQKYNKSYSNAESTYRMNGGDDLNTGNWWMDKTHYDNALSALDKVNSDISKDYAYIISEQVLLQAEIDEVENDIEDFETNLQREMNKLESDIEKLEQKAEEGTLTDEEQTELENKQGEYNNLPETLSGAINNKQNNIQNKAREFEIKSQIDEKANDYASTTIKKGMETVDYYTRYEAALNYYLSPGTSEAGIEHAEEVMEKADALLSQAVTSAELESDINNRLDTEKPDEKVEQKEFSFK